MSRPATGMRPRMGSVPGRIRRGGRAVTGGKGEGGGGDRISFRTRQNLGDSLAPDTCRCLYCRNPAALWPISFGSTSRRYVPARRDSPSRLSDSLPAASLPRERSLTLCQPTLKSNARNLCYEQSKSYLALYERIVYQSP